MDVTQDTDETPLAPGDWDKLNKREREEFHAAQEGMIQYLLKAGNDFQLRFPGLRVEWRFQVEVYQNEPSSLSVVRYSGRVY